MSYRIPTKYTGVFERIAKERKHQGKSDVCFDISYKLDGKRIFEKVGWLSEGYSAKLASQIRANRLQQIRHGEELPRQKAKAPYYHDVACKYLNWAKSNKTREGRDDEYRNRMYLAPVFDNKRLDEISPFDLERLKADLSKHLSLGSVKHCLVLFRQIFNKAIEWDLYQGENPIKRVKLPILQNQRQRFLSYEEAKLLMAELQRRSEQLHDIALLALHCGLRAGEIFNLKNQDIDIENELINVSDPKNKENRKAFMTKAVKQMFKNRICEKPDEFIFRDKKHAGPINDISRAFKRSVDKLKLNDGVTDPRQKITFHSLRHTFASWLALQGETILVIRDLLGHKSLAMTIRYAHLIPDQKRKATLNLEKKLLNANTIRVEAENE